MTRPKQPAIGKPRRTFTFRLTDVVRERVEASALASGRSVSETLERIVEAHFAGQDQRAMMREVVADVMAERFGRKIMPEDVLALMGDGSKFGVVRNLGPTIGGKSDA